MRGAHLVKPRGRGSSWRASRAVLFVAVVGVVSAFVFPGVQPVARAVSYDWIGGDGGLWSDAANWSGGIVPTGSEAILIDNGYPVLDTAFTLVGPHWISFGETGWLSIGPSGVLTIEGEFRGADTRVENYGVFVNDAELVWFVEDLENHGELVNRGYELRVGRLENYGVVTNLVHRDLGVGFLTNHPSGVIDNSGELHLPAWAWVGPPGQTRPRYVNFGVVANRVGGSVVLGYLQNMAGSQLRNQGSIDVSNDFGNILNEADALILNDTTGVITVSREHLINRGIVQNLGIIENTRTIWNYGSIWNACEAVISGGVEYGNVDQEVCEISASWVAPSTVVIDANPTEWSDVPVTRLSLDRVWGWPDRQVESGAKTMEASFMNDGTWLYGLYAVPWSVLDSDPADAAMIQLFFASECCGVESDLGVVSTANVAADLHGWDGSIWKVDTAVSPPGTNDFEGAGRHDGLNYWFEFRKRLDSGDSYDWTLSQGQEVGSPAAPGAEPHLIAAIWDESESTTFEQYLSLTLASNASPTVDADASPSPASGGGTVTLEASASDRDGDALAYSWTQTAGSQVTLVGSHLPTAEFVAPETLSATFAFEVTVSDGRGGTGEDDVVVAVVDPDAFAAVDVARTMLAPLETDAHVVDVPNHSAHLTATARWPGSDVELTLVAPSGRRINRHDTPSHVEHVLGATFETFTVVGPESGSWQVEIFGSDIPIEGEEVTVETITVAGKLDATVDVVARWVRWEIDDGAVDDVSPSRLWVRLYGSPELDVADIDPDTINLGDPALAVMVDPIRVRMRDTNRDGHPDLTLIFRTKEMIRKGAINPRTSLLQLTANTHTGARVIGEDRIRTRVERD